MYKICKTEQSSSRQHALEQGLLQQMCRKRFDEISISDLCQHMGITRKVFYRYFSGKEGALYSLMDHKIMEFYKSGVIEGLRGGTPRGDLERFFKFWYEQRDFLDALDRSELNGVLVERCTMLANREKLAPGLTQGWAPFKQEVVISFVICGLLAIVFRWHKNGFPYTPMEMAEVAVAMLSKPLLSKI